MDEYEEKLFEGVKNLTSGKRKQVETTKPKNKVGAPTVQEIIDSIV